MSYSAAAWSVRASSMHILRHAVIEMSGPNRYSGPEYEYFVISTSSLLNNTWYSLGISSQYSRSEEARPARRSPA